VVLEPACASVFRDELTNLMHGDRQAGRLAGQTWFFDEFASQRIGRFPLRPLGRRALMHAHCHQKAIAAEGAGAAIFERLGLDYTALDAGCCGMAGSFGFLEASAGVARRIGELGVLPAVRAEKDDALIVADGFSCREQIAQHAGRRALHAAELMRMAIAVEH
jgi:Fe-S oxidoreductase